MNRHCNKLKRKKCSEILTTKLRMDIVTLNLTKPALFFREKKKCNQKRRKYFSYYYYWDDSLYLMIQRGEEQRIYNLVIKLIFMFVSGILEINLYFYRHYI